MNLFKPQYLND